MSDKRLAIYFSVFYVWLYENESTSYNGENAKKVLVLLAFCLVFTVMFFMIKLKVMGHSLGEKFC